MRPRRPYTASSIVQTPELVPEEMLLAGMRTGSPGAARELVRRYQGRVFGIAFGVLRDPGLAEDIAQQAFEHAWRHAELYDPRRGTVRAWLGKIAHNLAVDMARVRRPAPVDPDELSALTTPVTDTPEHRALADETGHELRRAMAGLPPEQARAVVMAAVHGMTAAQIAQREAIPLGTAKARIRAAMTKLHAELRANPSAPTTRRR